MDKIFIAAASQVTGADALAARLGPRFRRLDLASQMALLAVERLGVDFSAHARHRVGICLGAPNGSLAADFEFWDDRDAVGGPSPTLFTYTLPSAAIGEIAIRHQITGPNLCLAGNAPVLIEAADWLRRDEVDACLCLECDVVSPALGEMMGAPPAAWAGAVFLRRGGGRRLLGENDLDMQSLCAAFEEQSAAG